MTSDPCPPGRDRDREYDHDPEPEPGRDPDGDTDRDARGRRGDDRRRHRRFAPKEVHSLLGEVLDISASGMRVLQRGKANVEVGETFDLLLQHGESHATDDALACDLEQDLVVPVRVVWVRPADARRDSVGLEITRHCAELEQRILALDPQYHPNGHTPPRAFLLR